MVIKRAEDYHNVLKYFPPVEEPAFETEASMLEVWGRYWGVDSEVGQLRAVLMHRPGDELKQIDESKWNEECNALIDDNGGWYWRDRKGPDIAKMQKQHDDFCDLIRKEGVEIVYLNYSGTTRSRAVFTRDVAIAIPGGVVICRVAPQYRRGEELAATQRLGGLGVPILRTITGIGILEGGNFSYLDGKHAVVGQSSRTNDEGIRQLREALAVSGIELITIPVTGYGLHIDGAFTMVTEDTALVNVVKLPYFFIQMLKKFNIKTIDVHPEDNWYAINCLQIKPGKLIMTKGSDHTAERLDKAGIEVIQTEYDEILKNGGGPHCSTCPLLRDRVY